MPPQETNTPQTPSSTPIPHHVSKAVWVGVAGAVLIFIGILMGVQIAHSNSDYVCSRAVTDSQQGACTGGNWTDWAMAADGTLQRTYTGTRSTVAFDGAVAVSCSHPQDASGVASGQITTQYAACQIIQTGTQSGSGTPSAPTATITATSQSEITDTVSSTTSQTTGTYADYQNTTDALLATSTFSVAPVLVNSGGTTNVSWTASHMKSCVVTATNGDTWVALNSTVGGEVSSPIMQQTIFTLTCTSAIGTQFVNHVTVNLVPTFQEQ